MKRFTDHEREVGDIARAVRQAASQDSTKRLRFAHGSTNSTRIKEQEAYAVINISHLNGILEINTQDQYAIVEPNVPMDILVSATLPYGLLPPVVMEFPGITVGGAINGAALESSSFRYGQFNDTCLEIEVILGDGEVVRATPEQHSDLFYGISGSYGTLGCISLVKLRLVPAQPYVHVTFYPTRSVHETLAHIKQQVPRDEVDYLEGIIFGPDHGVVILGTRSQTAHPPVETYGRARDQWFYQKAKRVTKAVYEEWVPIKEYLFRYNRGAFWMGEYLFPYFHIPNTGVTRFLLDPFLHTRKLYEGMHAVRHAQLYFIQDFYCPYDATEAFLARSGEELAIYPIWLCPVRSTQAAQKLSPHYNPEPLLMDIGIWGQSKSYLANPIELNRRFEIYAQALQARKMLYAQVYYTEKEFWSIYDRDWYAQLRRTYHAEAMFPELWEKVYVPRTYQMRKWSGASRVVWETFKEKVMRVPNTDTYS